MAIKGSHLLWIYNQITVKDFLQLIWKQLHMCFKHVPPTFEHQCARYCLLKYHTKLIKHVLPCVGKVMHCGLHVNKTIFLCNNMRDKSIPLPCLTAKWLQKARKDLRTGLSMTMLEIQEQQWHNGAQSEEEMCAALIRESFIVKFN